MTPRTAFAIPAFRRLWAAGLISDTGDWLLFIALPLVVFQLTGSALGTSIAFLLELVPAVVLAPLAARLIGRFDRRWIMVAVNIGQALALLPLLWVNEVADLPLAYAVIFVHASLSTLFEPAKNTLLPDLVDTERLVSANALIGLNQNLGRLIGGPLGGVLLAVGDLGLIVAADAVTYVISAVLIATLPAVKAAAHDRGSTDATADTPHPDSRDVRAVGLLAALRIRRLRGAFAVILVSSVAQGMFLVLFVLFALGPLRGSDADVGLLRGIQAVGAVVAGVVLGFIARGSSPRALTAASLFAFGALSLVTWNLPAVTTDVWPYVLLFAAVGAPGVIMIAGLMSVLQEESEPRQRGAVFAAVGLVSAVGQALGILLGALSDGAIGLLPLLEAQGCLYLLSGVIALLWLPRMEDRPTRKAEGATDAVSRTP
ncbi:MFS transporter [Microbacterium sp. QXD-8]|uniref:MFS transporter n=1 Tax=Microbacterium psychrotolerans TaxID=3068321 RepID=A0ABU0Z602_9MICO|nr:MFS transporter [Microbacterium sp. QXD-8]MDQ7880028.1 MFS transporter [Microbacterium sp. QXD-8]